MEDIWESDNIIQGIFEKAFDQLTRDGADLEKLPFEQIEEKTMKNPFIHQLINKLTKRPINNVKDYLANVHFRENFLFTKLKNKIGVQILLDNLNKIIHLIKMGYQINNKNINQVVLNNRLDILKIFVEERNVKLDDATLMIAAEFGYEKMYFFLRKCGLVPNFSVYTKAVIGGSLNIVKDICPLIGLSRKILENAFKANHTNIICFLISVANSEEKSIDPNLVTYPILNNNIIVLEEMEKEKLFQWHVELYYSAILSGSMEMLLLVESRLPNIHDNRILDKSRTRKGRGSLLVLDAIYTVDGNRYFSHTINYAIQSGSMEILEYLYRKGYEITPSNFITAVKQGSIEILHFLVANYNKPLPFYFMHYFGIHSYLANKMEKAKVLIDSGKLIFRNQKNWNVDDYRLETAHQNMIEQTNHLSEDGTNDIDYLMKYPMFFEPHKGYKLNSRLLSEVRLCLELELDQISHLIKDLNQHDVPLVVDCIYLYGSLNQIKIMDSLIMTDMVKTPSQPIIMEIMCYGQINKLCYLYTSNLLPNNTLSNLYPLATMLDDYGLNCFFQRYSNENQILKFVFLSGHPKLVGKWLENNPTYRTNILNKKEAKYLLKMDNIDIISQFRLDSQYLSELASWVNDQDLMEVKTYLQNLSTSYQNE